MDALDLDILRAMGVYPFLHAPRGPDVLKPAHVARQVGIALDTAKDRIRRLERSGVIRRYEAHLNLRHLGLTQGVFRFLTDAPDKREALARVASVDGVGDVWDHVGDGFDVTIHYAQHAELRRRLDLVAMVANATLHERYVEPIPPPVTRALTPLDWRIVRALRGQARRDPAEVARELGVSRRTVTRRVATMANEGSIDLQPILDPGVIENVIPMCVVCRFREGNDPRLVRGVLRALRGRLVYEWVPPSEAPGHLRLAAIARSLQEAEEIRTLALHAPSVASAEAQFPSRATWNNAWIDEAIDARIAAAPAKRDAPLSIGTGRAPGSGQRGA